MSYLIAKNVFVSSFVSICTIDPMHNGSAVVQLFACCGNSLIATMERFDLQSNLVSGFVSIYAIVPVYLQSYIGYV